MRHHAQQSMPRPHRVRPAAFPQSGFYQQIRSACGAIAFIRAEYVPHDESQPHAHALTETLAAV